ncbi:MAG: membrane dipeptidase [Clostridia bacterium]|nr:membrane dipeptidase [Clostridia bacterium]
MKLSLFDLHCDTSGEMLRQTQALADNSLAVSLNKATVFERYIQVMAHWTQYSMSEEEAWNEFLAMINNLKKDPSVTAGTACISTACPDANHVPTLLLAVEDARILNNKIERVDQLYQMGVRILTPLWKGDTCIGGSHDTENGLTHFGKSALERAVGLGMIPDISHASRASAEEIFAIAKAHGRPVIASHSNAHAVCPVSRNLWDDQIRALLDSDGLIGLNLYTAFLTPDGNASAKDILPHIEHFLSLGAEKHLALGCDMDGCRLPDDIPDLAALPRLAELLLQHNYSEELVADLFYNNAYAFASQYLK